MYNSQIVTERIKNIAKDQGITMDFLNSSCKLSKNTISNAGKSSEGMKAKNLYMIAECLNVSTDYLLGRTDTPQITINGNNNISQNNISGNATANIGTVDNERSDSDAQELLGMINRLSLVQRAEIILKINDMLK